MRLTESANNANPLIDQLRPAARQLSPTLISASRLAPDLKRPVRGPRPAGAGLARRACRRSASSSTRRVPLLAQIDPFLRDLNPFLDCLGLYKHELTAFFANSTAATEATFPLDASRPTGARAHYLRTTNPVNPENLAVYPNRIASNRSNPYTEPLGFNKLATGLEVFGSYLCTNNPVPQVVNTTDPNNPGVGPPTTLLAPSTFDLIQQFIYDNKPASQLAAPPARSRRRWATCLGSPACIRT